MCTGNGEAKKMERKEISIIDGAGRIDDVRSLIKEYTDWIGLDLSFQSLEDELADPAKKYTAPEGELLLATVREGAGQDGPGEERWLAAGMVAYRRHDEKRCEMKRLYVRPSYRGSGAGRMLADEIIKRARAAGYTEMVLDNLDFMDAAYEMYLSLGFTECEPYYDNPIPGTRYMIKQL